MAESIALHDIFHFLENPTVSNTTNALESFWDNGLVIEKSLF